MPCLFPALVADVRAGRARAGRLAVKDMLVGIGPPVLPRLLPLLEDPAVPFPTIVEVIDKVGDVASKDKAGEALVARARKLSVLPETLYAGAGHPGRAGARRLPDVPGRQQQPPDAERAAVALASLRRAKGVAAFAVRKAPTPPPPPPLRDRLFEVAEQSHGEEASEALLAQIRGQPRSGRSATGRSGRC